MWHAGCVTGLAHKRPRVTVEVRNLKTHAIAIDLTLSGAARQESYGKASPGREKLSGGLAAPMSEGERRHAAQTCSGDPNGQFTDALTGSTRPFLSPFVASRYKGCEGDYG